MTARGSCADRRCPLSSDRAVGERTDKLLAAGVFPEPSGDWPAIPWPAF